MEPVPTKLPKDLKDQLENYADARDITRSKAVRDLLYESLDEETSEYGRPIRDMAHAALVGAFTVFLALTFPPQEAIAILAGGVAGVILMAMYQKSKYHLRIQLVSKPTAEREKILNRETTGQRTDTESE